MEIISYNHITVSLYKVAKNVYFEVRISCGAYGWGFGGAAPLKARRGRARAPDRRVTDTIQYHALWVCGLENKLLHY